MRHILDIKLTNEFDLLAARQRTRQVAAICGFTPHEQTRLSTAVSELARAATSEARPGSVVLHLTGDAPRQSLVITVSNRTSGGRADHPAGADTTAEQAISSSIRGFVDSVDVNVTADGVVVVLFKVCAPGGRHLDGASIQVAVEQLEPLPSHVALSEASRHVHEAAVKTESISSENRELHERAGVLLSADQRKDEFLAILAHELRGPLSAVSMAAAMLAKGMVKPSQAVDLGELIARQSGHMSRLVEDLLDVSRIVRNDVSIDRIPVDIRDVVALAVEQLAPAAQRRNHRVVVRLAQNRMVVVGDRTRLIQVFGNLIGNAVRYTPDGGNIEITVAPCGVHVCVAVSDDGIGIPAELLPSLFDMFKQAQRPTDGRNGGLGLGLALVKTLVEAHHGTIAGASDGAGRGATFEVCLPALAAQAGDVDGPIPAAAASTPPAARRSAPRPGAARTAAHDGP